MDRNLFLAIALSVLVYAGWFAWLDRRMPPSSDVVSSAPALPEEAAPAPAPLARESAPEAPPVGLTLPWAELSFAPKGGALASFRYLDPLTPAELVERAEPGFLAAWPEVVFAEAGRGARSVVLRGRAASGVALTKTFEFPAEPGPAKLTLTLTNPGRLPADPGPLAFGFGPGLGTFKSEQKENPRLWRALQHLPAKKRAKKVKPGKEPEPGWDWAGVDNRYFLAALRPEGEVPALSVEAPEGPDGKEAPLARFTLSPGALAAGESRSWSFGLYLGPKDFDALKATGWELHRAVDFGFFGSIGRLVFRTLRFIHAATGNYGWAIILLTALIQALTFPLTFKSLKASAGMKKLQPKIAALQQRFKDDPKRMNVEMMQLYKATGTNPLAGCVPMLLQIPIFIALFTTLRNAWDLHGAPFHLWIRDLSAADPFYVLPITMGGIMFVQQKMGPAAPDPQQAKMMQFMPIIFTFMFLNFPAGLVLYWMTNSALSLLLQTALKSRLEA